MAEWIECSIGDLCNTISDTYKGNDEYVVLVNTSDVLEGKVLNHEAVANKNLKGQFKKTFKRDDILYSEIRPANKRFAYIDFENTSNYIASTKLMVLRHNDKILPEYLFALLKSNYVIAELQHLAETRSGTFPQITFSSELAPMKVFLPDKDTQKRIVSILSSIEQKIDKNTEINNNLEQQAQAIFLKMFPDIFSASSSSSFQNLIEFSNGKKRPEAIGNIPVYGGNGILAYTNQSNAENSVIIGRVGAYCGNTFLCPEKCWISDNAIQAKSKNEDSQLFIYYLLRNASLPSRHIGTGQPLMTQAILNAVPVNEPSTQEIRSFINVCTPLHETIFANEKQNISLTILRDTLLPKLMSGELDVSDIDI